MINLGNVVVKCLWYVAIVFKDTLRNEEPAEMSKAMLEMRWSSAGVRKYSACSRNCILRDKAWAALRAESNKRSLICRGVHKHRSERHHSLGLVQGSPNVFARGPHKLLYNSSRAGHLA